MGKLIDNHVDKSDITSLIYYWASKGFIKINMEDKDDIKLIRLVKDLPGNAPNYQRTVYYGLFASSDLVRINSLTGNFGRIIEKATAQVNAENDKLYSGTSMAFAVIFALLGLLAIGLTPILLAILNINAGLLIILPMFMVVPVFIVFALTQSVRYRALKYGAGKIALCLAGIAVIAALFSLLYILAVPAYVVELLPKILLCLVGFAIVMLSVTLISRTPEYSRTLGKIMGFRDFIENVEKDKLEAMLAGNPEFYYDVLPYANVLGVSDIWEKKFQGLTLDPPSWVAGSYTTADAVFDLMLFNAAMRSFDAHLASVYAPHPSAGASSGFHGSFGGFSGGGHGGGGFRGK